MSVVTPIYNTAEYLVRCIESVLGQSYRNFEYLLVNNCSTDGSLDIAERYAREDSRIRVLNNKTFLCQVDNYNGALLHISPESRYCKVVSADDWIFPNCLERMVAVAEAHPSAGIVGCHYLEGDDNFKGLRYPSPLMDGSTACRMHLIDCVPLFGSPTNLLMRSPIIRGRKPFYERDSHHFDTELCYAVLRDWDFGYAQEVLAFLRPPSADSVTGGHQELGTYHLSRLVRMRKYGWPWLFADKREYRRHYKGIEREYAASLITRLMVSRRRREVWQVHSRVLAQCGYKLSWYQVAAAALGRRLQRAWSASTLATRS